MPSEALAETWVKLLLGGVAPLGALLWLLYYLFKFYLPAKDAQHTSAVAAGRQDYLQAIKDQNEQFGNRQAGQAEAHRIGMQAIADAHNSAALRTADAVTALAAAIKVQGDMMVALFGERLREEAKRKAEEG